MTQVPPKRYGTKTDRNHLIQMLRANGASLVDLARQFGMSRQRVHQILTPSAHRARSIRLYHVRHPDASYHDKTSTPVRKLITALGGSSAVARAVGIGASTVSNWLAHGSIPPKRYLVLAEVAARHNVELDTRLFREISHRSVDK
jgi:DNA invertase Pin-like site-specific DNA recombinase